MSETVTPPTGSIPTEEILKRAWQLRAANDFLGLDALLEPLPREVLLAEPELGVRRAQSLSRYGRHRESLDLLRALTEPLRRMGNGNLARRAALTEGRIHIEHGDLEEAERIYNRVREEAASAGDEHHIAAAWHNLGVIADIRCRWDEAIADYQRAYASFQRTGRLANIASSHHCLAMAYRQLGMYAESHTHFEHATPLFIEYGIPADLPATETERAVLLCLMGDLRLAEATARRALRGYDALGHRRGRGEALRVLGIIALAGGKLAAARACQEEALEIAVETGNRLLQAEVHEELAALAQAEGRPAAVEEEAERAAAIYTALGAETRAGRMRARLAGRAAA